MCIYTHVHTHIHKHAIFTYCMPVRDVEVFLTSRLVLSTLGNFIYLFFYLPCTNISKNVTITCDAQVSENSFNHGYPQVGKLQSGLQKIVFSYKNNEIFRE